MERKIEEQARIFLSRVLHLNFLLSSVSFLAPGAVNTLVYAFRICIQHHLSWLMAGLSPLQPELNTVPLPPSSHPPLCQQSAACSPQAPASCYRPGQTLDVRRLSLKVTGWAASPSMMRSDTDLDCGKKLHLSLSWNVLCSVVSCSLKVSVVFFN